MEFNSIRPALNSFLTAHPSFSDGSDSPRAFLERCIAVIESLEPAVGAFVELNLEAARTQADASTARWTAGKPSSLIDGMPVGVKDIIETADMVTEQGSPLFKGWRGGRDAASVAALREAGAIILGKTVTTEFAATEPSGTRNPWDLERSPGGSSSGSGAAVGAGMIPAALGTQVIGSILRPASFCGCFGYKPSVGGINRGGSFDLLSQSCTGVLGASLHEVWTVAREISSRAGGDAGSPGILGPLHLPDSASPSRIALIETGGWHAASDEARSALRDVAERLGAAGVTISDRHSDRVIEEVETAIADASVLSRQINDWEGRWPLNTYARDLDRSKLSRRSLTRLANAEAMTQEHYQALLLRREHARRSFESLHQRFDVCLTLSATGAAPVGLESTGDAVFVAPASLLGTPSLSLPLLHEQGLPLGLQVMGFRDADASMFSATRAIVSVLAER